jgi:4-hydroxy-3-polyprenylbenzoate decarboxylase
MAVDTQPRASVHDLRTFLDALEAVGELGRITVPVALDQEIGAVCYRNLTHFGPGLLFERPGNSDIPLAVDLLASRRRYALALGTEPELLAAEWNRRVAQLRPPVLIARGACQEVVHLGRDVDLTRLPAPIWNDLDGGPYLTLSCHVTKDPQTGARNVGVYRNQVHDRDRLGLLAGPYTHLGLQRRHIPNEPFPVALVIGADPVVLMTATSPVPFGTDELAVAGALRESPLEVVPCVSVPLEVPASAEIVIEGQLLPDDLMDEGPFGEFTGYYGGPTEPRQVIRVTAITHRDRPILQQTYEGRPPHESAILTGVPREAELMRQIALPGIKRVHVTAPGGGALHAVVAIEKLYEGYGKAIGMAVLGTHPGRFIKQVIVVEDDVDPFDPLAVEWAIATRVQPHRDMEIIKDVTGIILDPSLPRSEQSVHARTSKTIIDATRYDAKSYPALCVPRPDVQEQVDGDWARYGLPSAERPL